jgi:ATP-dependent RNA helicase DDX23/PRP28
VQSLQDATKKEAAVEKRQPLSLDELIAKRTAEQSAESKPVFLSREERAALALKRRAEHVEAQAKARLELGKNKFSSAALLEQDHQRMNEEERERWYRQREVGKDRDREMDAIKSRYLGGEKKRRKLRRLADRKFVFDWDAGDDTSVDFNPLYRSKHQALFFGRGHIAGIDIKAQKKEQSKFYSNLMGERMTDDQKKQARVRDESVMEKERKTKFDERHWSEKSLPEMAYRDWRIFREDYNISTKGGRIPYPLRSWEEAGLNSEVLEVIHSLHYKVDTSVVCTHTHACTQPRTHARTHTHTLHTCCGMYFV